MKPVKKRKKKYPDQVVWDEKRGFYAKILPYGSNVSAPAFTPTDVSTWRKQASTRAEAQLATKLKEIQTQYLQLVEEAYWNNLLYTCQYGFNPIVGRTYYLYRRQVQEYFLSLIEPEHWPSRSKDFVGCFSINSELKWEKDYLSQIGEDLFDSIIKLPTAGSKL